MDSEFLVREEGWLYCFLGGTRAVVVNRDREVEGRGWEDRGLAINWNSPGIQ
jgi:hypothetical protein